MKYLIDANIFLEAQLDQGNSEICRDFLAEVQKGNIEAMLTMFHADTIAVTMENQGIQEKISGFMLSLYMYEGLDVVNIELASKAKAMMNDNDLNFDDSIAFQALEELEIDFIVSYDEDFDQAIRKTPKEVLEDTTS